MRQKRCKSCHKLYLPEPRSYLQQKTCNKPSCRTWRKRQAQKAWSLKNPFYWDGFGIKQELWRKKHPHYWREWRKAHLGYVVRNRKLQKQRDAQKRGFLAKQDDWNTICIEKLERIASLRLLAKQDDWMVILSHQIDGIVNYLKAESVLAKQDNTDKRN